MAEDDSPSGSASETGSGKSPQNGPQDRGNFMPLVFGGAVATIIGFFAAQLDGVERALGLAPAESGLEQIIEAQADDIARQAGLITAQDAKISDLEAGLAAVPEPTPPADLTGLETRVAQALSALDARIVQLEKRPMTEGLSPEAVAAYEAELTRLQQSLDTQRAEIEAMIDTARASEADAETKARQALARAALTGVITAVDSGKPFGNAVAELDASGGAEVPTILRELAETGVPTLASLQEAFPDVARAALSADRSQAAADGDGGIGSFLQRQLGVRSVTPQEGNSADAVLSRAQAAVNSGQLPEALAELGALSDAAKEPLAGWLETAGKRLAATEAADELLTALSTN